MTALAMSPAISFRLPVLPWSVAAEDERRFQRILGRVLLLVLALGLVFPFIPLREPERVEVKPLAPAMARLLLDQKPAPLPPPPAVTRTPEPEATQPQAAGTPKPPTPADKPRSVAPPKPGAPVPEARNPVDGKPPGEIATDTARRRASGVGLLAMKEQLAEMTGAPVAVQLKQDIKPGPGPGVGTGSGPGVGAGSEAGLPARAMITSNATRGSGGINTAAYSRDTGGGGLAGRSTTLVEGAAGGGGGGGPGGGGSRAGGGNGLGDGNGGSGGAKGGQLSRGNSGKAARSIEDIKLVFERNKGAIYAIYNRALRDEPALQGKVVLELKIAPGGEVTGLRIVSSELKADALEQKLLARIRQFDFGAKDVDLMVVTWPVDFLPS